MNSTERRARIRANLGIEPISHGQVYTYQIAIPPSEQQDIPLERHQQIEDSLTQHKSNLIPLIVRRTEAYSEEEEYELVHGADWCIVAKELNIEKLWVWVFDMTDEQAIAAKAEMQDLVDVTHEKNGDGTEITDLLEQKLKPIYAKLNQLASSNNPAKVDADELKGSENKLDQILAVMQIVTEQLQKIVPPDQLNLNTATDEEINSILEEVGVNTLQRPAVLEAIRYWQQPGKTLTWQNLKKSVDSKDHKIKNFGKGLYQKLKEKTDIR
jgi:DNA uptake protein ComE-like DNA-binding protein